MMNVPHQCERYLCKSVFAWFDALKLCNNSRGQSKDCKYSYHSDEIDTAWDYQEERGVIDEDYMPDDSYGSGFLGRFQDFTETKKSRSSEVSQTDRCL